LPHILHAVFHDLSVSDLAIFRNQEP